MPNLNQIGRKLAQLGGLGPLKFEKVLPAKAGTIKRKCGPQRRRAEKPPRNHQGTHVRDQLPPVPLKEDLKD